MAAGLAAGAVRVDDPRQRTYVSLDGLRGVAALAVVTWHLHVWRPLGSAYLAVDLFFMLSGFVLANRYEGRLARPGFVARFTVMRLIRLYPLYLAGTAIGAAWALVGLATSHAGMTGTLDWGRSVALALPGIPDLNGPRGLVYPMNVPAWSLFYEVIVNILYAVIAPWLGARRLAALVALSGIGLVAASAAHGNLNFNGVMPDFAFGAIRVVFGFFVGVALCRLALAGRLRVPAVPPLLLGVALLALLALPSDGRWAWQIAAAAAVIGFPAIIMSAVQERERPAGAALMSWLGLLSFPLYAVHVPVLNITFRAARAAHLPTAVMVVAGIAAAIVVALLVARLWDEPVRRLLNRRVRGWLARPVAQPREERV